MGRMGMEGGGRAGDCREASTNSKAVSICASRPTFFCCSCGRGDRGGGARIVVVVVVVVIVVVVVAVVVGGQAKSFAGSYLPPQPFVSSRLASQRGGGSRATPPFNVRHSSSPVPPAAAGKGKGKGKGSAAQGKARQGKTSDQPRVIAVLSPPLPPSARVREGGPRGPEADQSQAPVAAPGVAAWQVQSIRQSRISTYICSWSGFECLRNTRFSASISVYVCMYCQLLLFVFAGQYCSMRQVASGR